MILNYIVKKMLKIFFYYDFLVLPLKLFCCYFKLVGCQQLSYCPLLITLNQILAKMNIKKLELIFTTGIIAFIMFYIPVQVHLIFSLYHLSYLLKHQIIIDEGKMFHFVLIFQLFFIQIMENLILLHFNYLIIIFNLVIQNSIIHYSQVFLNQFNQSPVDFTSIMQMIWNPFLKYFFLNQTIHFYSYHH